MYKELQNETKIRLFDLLFGSRVGIGDRQFGREVDYSLAKGCIRKYKEISRDTTPGNLQAKLKLLKTKRITFENVDLQLWFEKVFDPSRTNAKHVNIRLGVYTREYVEAFGLPDNMKGRLTVFLWPYKNNRRPDPNNPEETEDDIEENDEAENNSVDIPENDEPENIPVNSSDSTQAFMVLAAARKANPYNLGDVHP